MEILNIHMEKRFMLKFYVTKNFTLLRLKNMMNTKEVLLQLFTNFLTKKSATTNTRQELTLIKILRTNN